VHFAVESAFDQNLEEARKWYRKAAKLGNADAQFMLYQIYREGIGVEKNPKKAEKWRLRATETGCVDAK
jgi:uncharacterized protein